MTNHDRYPESKDSAPEMRVRDAPYVLRDHIEFIRSSEHRSFFSEEGLVRAKQEIAHIAPDAKLISDNGSSAVIFGSGASAYKVYRGIRYDYTENEASMFKLLGDAGFAPRMYMFHEPPLEKQFADSDMEVVPYVDNFPRATNDKLAVPILEMQRLTIPPEDSAQPVSPSRFDALTSEEVREQFQALAGFVLENQIDLRGEAELTVDLERRRLTLIDLGDVRQDETLDTEDYLAGKVAQMGLCSIYL